MIRILTYNVHRCVGTDRRLDVGRVADVIAAQSPDIVALQEVDVGRARTDRVDQAHAIAERLGMTSRFNAAISVEEESYGDALLTALPEQLIKAGPLPGYALAPGLEARGALWIAIEVEGVELQVLNTHLGLVPGEQLGQAGALVGPDWLGDLDPHVPMILLGDFNAGPRSPVCRCFLRSLSDARDVAPRSRSATYPSRMPLLKIDHVFVSDSVDVHSIHVPVDAVARKASDHLPLVVDFEIRPAVD